MLAEIKGTVAMFAGLAKVFLWDIPRGWLCWLRGGHRLGYDHHGPPVQDFGGPWYRCVRCGNLYHYPGWRDRVLTTVDDTGRC